MMINFLLPNYIIFCDKVAPSKFQKGEGGSNVN